eukprot:TRINITY_DN5462_c0_g1_i1.p1 TRINITY_DN5462_c0_g1~~TRINITY_DN5462_c0_g1_i1.p1  ORF type:complete len:285 (-),score=25.64 TRINITY_DN5462_c0_g1_i1:79-933(-)
MKWMCCDVKNVSCRACDCLLMLPPFLATPLLQPQQTNARTFPKMEYDDGSVPCSTNPDTLHPLSSSSEPSHDHAMWVSACATRVVFSQLSCIGLYGHILPLVSRKWYDLYHERPRHALTIPPMDKDGCVDLSTYANLLEVPIKTILIHMQYDFRFTRRLKITASFELDNNMLLHIARKNPDLTHIYLMGCSHLTFKGIMGACAYLTHLCFLDVRGIFSLSTTASLACLREAVPNVLATPEKTSYYNYRTPTWENYAEMEERRERERQKQAAQQPILEIAYYNEE